MIGLIELTFLILIIALAVFLGTRGLRKPRTRAEWEWQQEQLALKRGRKSSVFMFMGIISVVFLVGILITLIVGAVAGR